jgi:hypothetical protein
MMSRITQICSGESTPIRAVSTVPRAPPKEGNQEQNLDMKRSVTFLIKEIVSNRVIVTGIVWSILVLAAAVGLAHIRSSRKQALSGGYYSPP